MQDVVGQALLLELGEEDGHRRDSVVVVGGAEALRKAANGADGVLRDRGVCIRRKCLQHGSEARVVARSELWHISSVNHGLHGVLLSAPFFLGKRSGCPFWAEVT